MTNIRVDLIADEVLKRGSRGGFGNWRLTNFKENIKVREIRCLAAEKEKAMVSQPTDGLYGDLYEETKAEKITAPAHLSIGGSSFWPAFRFDGCGVAFKNFRRITREENYAGPANVVLTANRDIENPKGLDQNRNA